MKLVRIVKNWKSPDLMRQTPDFSGVWGDVKFTVDPVEECDYLLVLNYIPQDIDVACPKENIWVMLQEPYVPGIFDWVVDGHEQFSRVYTHREDTISDKYHATQTCLPWHINRSYDQLVVESVPHKSKSLSWVTTNKKIFPGHKRRMKFFEYISESDSISVDLYGRGINVIADKFDALSPYKYSLAIENSSSNNYWTEKISDCLLSYTLPIYYGCTNLSKYFPDESFVSIDINKPDEAVEIIRQTIAEDGWSHRLDAIREARELVLNKYQLFPFITREIEVCRGGTDKIRNVLRAYD